MKKILVVLASALLCLTANAKFYVGGSLGFETTGTKLVFGNQSELMGGHTSFYFSPEFGAAINDDWAAGARLNLNPYNTIDVEGVKTNCFNWNINPYARYRICSFKKFGIWAEADLSLGTNRDSGFPYSEFRYGIEILPVLTFDVSEHLVLVSNLNFAGIGWNGSSRKLSDNTSSVSNTFGFNAGNASILSFGVFYKF